MRGKSILKGLSCPGDKRVVTCRVRVIPDDNLNKLAAIKPGECIVSEDLKPEKLANVDEYLAKAAGIIQNTGGKGCHANMFAFAHNIPAISDTYGQSGQNATEVLKDGQEIELESFTETVEIVTAEKVRRKNIGTVYEHVPDQGIPGGLGKPTLADIMKKYGVQK